MKAWLVRSGSNGERDEFCLSQGFCGGGYSAVADLSDLTAREQIKSAVVAAIPEATPGKVNNFAGQLFAFRSLIQIGDLVVLPLKTTREIAIGRITSDYLYRGEDPDSSRHHVRRVEWTQTDVARSAIKPDLLYSLGAFMTICAISRNDAVWRLEQVEATQSDPGARPNYALPQADSHVDEVDVDLEKPEVELGEYARDRIRTLITEIYDGYGLERLIAAILEAQGFYCERRDKPKGADGGIDVLAGKGPLGLDSPRIVVQAKLQSGRIGPGVVRELNSAINDLSADQGLLVAWAGLTPDARSELRGKRFLIRVWEADDVVDALTASYDQLSESIRVELPLRQVWIPIESAG